MPQESIWEASLKDEVQSNPTCPILIKRTTPHKLTDIELRNYFNLHSVDEIDINSMYDYFKENLFAYYKGLYLPHLICAAPFVSYDKIYKALSEVFQVISPNTGSNTEENFNYFQYYWLIWRSNQQRLIQAHSKELYELGIEHGLDLAYRDSASRSNAYYFAASAPLDFILKNFETFIVPDNNIYASGKVSISDVIEKRFLHNYGCTSLRLEKQDMNAKDPLFSKIARIQYFYEYNHIEKTWEWVYTDDWKTYQKIYGKIKKLKIKD